MNGMEITKMKSQRRPDCYDVSQIGIHLKRIKVLDQQRLSNVLRKFLLRRASRRNLLTGRFSSQFIVQHPPELSAIAALEVLYPPVTDTPMREQLQKQLHELLAKEKVDVQMKIPYANGS
jgi:hypothetical protein